MNDHDTNTALNCLPTSGPVIKDGTISFPGLDMSAASLVRTGNDGWQPVQDLDAAALQALLTALLDTMRRSGGTIADVLLPEFLKMACRSDNHGDAVSRAKNLFQEYADVYARFEDGSIYAVLQPVEIDEAANTVGYVSPYIDYLLRKI